jgi:hypothetical protein
MDVSILKHYVQLRRLNIADVEFMRRTTGYSLLDDRINVDILEEHKVDTF